MNTGRNAPSHFLVNRVLEHPWTQLSGWVTEQYSAVSHDSALYAADAMSMDGWSIWIVSNVGQPGFVVYRELDDEMRFVANVRQWADNRNLIQGSTPEKQMLKLTEEVGELAAALARGHVGNAEDAIGDCAVVLVILSEQLGLDFHTCCERAWEQIKDRKGKMVDGVFVKDEM
jgi:NTP pyrophosphatase (non-canonical NTP hydrolase)